MTTRQFPKIFKELWKAPDTRASFVSEIAPLNPHDCENCGGVGSLYTFIATKGPFNSPGMMTEVSHWHNDKWWVGKHHSAPCPVCQGTGNNGNQGKAGKLYPVGDKVREMADTMKGAR